MSRKWYAEGVRFQCQGSGQCCVSHGEYGAVYLTLKDRQNLAKELKLTTREFTQKYCVKQGSSFLLKELFLPDGNPNPNCLFLKNKKCSVYKARPTQCRTWPFWPDNMKAKVWQSEVVTFCPGVNKGPLYDLDSIEKILTEEQRAEKEIFSR